MKVALGVAAVFVAAWLVHLVTQREPAVQSAVRGPLELVLFGTLTTHLYSADLDMRCSSRGFQLESREHAGLTLRLRYLARSSRAPSGPLENHAGLTLDILGMPYLTLASAVTQARNGYLIYADFRDVQGQPLALSGRLSCVGGSAARATRAR